VKENQSWIYQSEILNIEMVLAKIAKVHGTNGVFPIF
jgi:hypothetical protein